MDADRSVVALRLREYLAFSERYLEKLINSNVAIKDKEGKVRKIIAFNQELQDTLTRCRRGQDTVTRCLPRRTAGYSHSVRLRAGCPVGASPTSSRQLVWGEI